MSRYLVGRIVNGVYVRASGDASPTHDIMADYYKGIAPSDLARLDARQLYTAAARLYESVSSGVGSASERAGAAEAYHECIRERMRRRATIR